MTAKRNHNALSFELYQGLAKSNVDRKAMQISLKTGVDPYADPAGFKAAMRAAQSFGAVTHDH